MKLLLASVLALIVLVHAAACATAKTVHAPDPDIRLTLNGAHRSVVYLRPGEAYLVVRFGEDAPEELLRWRAVAWDFGDGNTATQDRYEDGRIVYVLRRWHSYRAFGTFIPRVWLYAVDGRMVGTDSARIQIGASE